MTSAGDGEILSRRELRARHPERFRAQDTEPSEVAEATRAPHAPVADASDAEVSDLFAPVPPAPAPVLVVASAASAPPPPAPPALEPAPTAFVPALPVLEPALPALDPAEPAALRPFTLDLPPAPDWTTVASPVVPPTIDVSAWVPTGPQRANTGAVWWIVVLPMLSGIVLAGLLIANPATLQILLGAGTINAITLEAALSAMLWLVGAAMGLSFVVLLLSLIIGFRDRAKLRELGHTSAASPWWIVLSPLIYLIIRTVHAKRATGRGSAPLVAWLVLYVLPSVILTILQLAALFV